MKICRNLVLPIVIASCLAVTACAGGGGAHPTKSLISSPTKAEGLYLGMLAAKTSEANLVPFLLLILENGEYWWMHGPGTASTLVLDNFVQGKGKSTGTTFASTTSTHFADPTIANASLTAIYVPNVSIDGASAASHLSATFSGVPSPRENYDHNAAANLSTIAGAWFLNTLDRQGAAINIGVTGVISGRSGACTLTGAIAPRESGKNVFNTSITFGPHPCPRAGQTSTGIGLSYLINDGGTRQLIIAGVDSGRTVSTALYGTRKSEKAN